MMKKRMMTVVALTLMLTVVAVSSPAMVGCQAEDSTTAQHTTISAWGNNFFGQLGNETYNTNSNTPVEVSNLDGADLKALAGGQGHSLALKNDGTVWAWGLNQYGQLGDDTYTDTSTPVQVNDPTDPTGYLSGVTAIAAGSSHSLALKSDGTVWSWGSNTGGQEQKISGQLGNDTYTDSSTPVQVSDLDEVKDIAAGSSYSLALKSDGTVWAWGYNEFGQLGDGTNANSTQPVKVGDLSRVEAIAAGSSHGLALKDDGTIWAWGSNTGGQEQKISGQLGNDTYTDSSTPVQVSDLNGVEDISAGGSHNLALKDDGTVWAWGTNPYGQLGNGTNTDSSTPVQVSDLSGVTLIAAGDDQSLAA